jgi:hypothetical protein
VNGKATASLNGNITDETFSGAYTVNPDCTGKFAFDVFNLQGTKMFSATLDLVFDNNARNLRALFTSFVLPDGTASATGITVEAKRIKPDSDN